MYVCLYIIVILFIMGDDNMGVLWILIVTISLSAILCEL